MIDLYALIAIGFGLAIGIIPVIYSYRKTGGKDFLVAYYTDKEEFKKYIKGLKRDGYWIED